MPSNTFQLPPENTELPENSGSETIYNNEASNSSEYDPRLGLGRAVTELDANVKTEEWGEHANMGRKEALLTAKFVIGLRQHTSVDPEKAAFN